MSLLTTLLPYPPKTLDQALASYGAILLYRHFQNQPSRQVEKALHTWLNGDKPILLDQVQSLEIGHQPKTKRYLVCRPLAMALSSRHSAPQSSKTSCTCQAKKLTPPRRMKPVLAP